MADVRTERRAQCEGLESRVDAEAGHGVVRLWGTTPAELIMLLTMWR